MHIFCFLWNVIYRSTNTSLMTLLGHLPLIQFAHCENGGGKQKKTPLQNIFNFFVELTLSSQSLGHRLN